MKININDKKKTPAVILNLVLDGSGSMADKRDVVISGVNEYVESLRNKEEDDNYIVNLMVFRDSEVEHVYTGARLKDIARMTRDNYKPSGGTPLYDCIGEAIYQADVQKRAAGDATVLTFIFTDGEENMSSKFNSLTLHNLIQSKEKTNDWTFTFIGADKSCLEQARSIGISGGNSIQFDPTQFVSTMSNLAFATQSYTSNVNSGALRSTQCFYQDAGLDNSRSLDDQELTSTDSPLSFTTTTTGTTQKP
jgi:Mg-chelatase subunit ChlD